MIGVLFDKDNKLTDFYQVNKIVIYEMKDQPEIYKTIDNLAADTSDIPNFRKWMLSIMEKLEQKMVLVGTQITGIPFHMLGQQEYVLCEAPSFSQELLLQIFSDLVKQKDDKANIEEIGEGINSDEAKVSLIPVSLDHEGNYFLDFKEIQRVNPDISSKKVMLPFLNNTLFQSLTVICSHAMPWLDTFLEQKNMQYSVKREQGQCTLIITHKLCSE